MGVSVCPATVIAAPIERVWALLADPASWPAWMDAQVESARPPGAAQPGQTVQLSSRALGRTWRITIQVEAVDAAARRLQLWGRFPFGIEDRAVIVCAPAGAAATRVQYG